MLKKMLSILLIGLVMNLAIVTAFAETKKEKDLADKLKSEITKLGVGIDAKIQVKLKDGTKIKGYVLEIGNDQFVVINEKNSQATPIPYSQVKQAKGKSDKYYLVFGIIGIVALIVVIIVAGKS